jgi:hypothetical protein
MDLGADCLLDQFERAAFLGAHTPSPDHAFRLTGMVQPADLM